MVDTLPPRTIHQLQAAYDAVEVPILVTDTSGQVLLANTAVRALCSDVIELVGRMIWTLTPDAAAADSLKAIYAGHILGTLPREISYTLQPWFNGCGGRVTWALNAHIPMPYGEPYIVHTARQIEPAAICQDPAAAFRSFADHVPVMMWLRLHPDGLMWFNTQWYEATGVQDPLRSVQSLALFMHHEDVERRELLLEEAIAAAEPLTVEYRLRQGGVFRWVRETAQPFFDFDGQLLGYVGTCTDIQDIRDAIQALHHSQMQAHAITATAGDAIITCDADERITLWNASAEEVFGFAAHQMIGTSLTAVLKRPLTVDHTGTIQTLFEGLADTGTDTTLSLEMIGCHADGEEIPLEVTLSFWETDDGRYITAMVRDISQRQAVTARLRQLYQAIESSSTSIVITSQSGVIEYVNPKFIELTGYSREEAIGQKPGLVSSGMTPPETYQEMWAQLTNGRTWRGEFLNRKKDGTLYWEWATISPIFNEQGDISHYVAVKEDITLRKEMESHLRSSRQRMSDIIQQNIDGMVVLDQAGVVRFVNPAALRMFNRPLEDLMNRPFGIPVLAGNLTEMQLLQADGELRHIEVRVSEIEWDGAAAFLIGLHDVTERTYIADQLRQSEANLQALLDSSHIAFVLLGPDGRVRVANRLARQAEVLGWGDPVEVSARLDEFLSRDAFSAVNERFQLALMGHSNSMEREIRLNGKRLWFELHFHPVVSPYQQVLGAFLSSEDITERKMSAERALQLRLERERMKVLTRFIRDASHEFRTPLSIINTSAALLGHIDDTERRNHKISTITAQVGRITRLVDDLILLTSLDDQTSVKMMATDVGDLVRQLSDAHQEDAAAQGITLNLIVQRGLQASVNARLLREALARLLDNALHFTAAAGQVTLRAERTETHLILSVSDTGVGIADEHQPQIFDRFFRADDAHSSSGFGLGLPIVRRVAELHGGEVHFRSQVGVGSSFILHLPLH